MSWPSLRQIADREGWNPPRYWDCSTNGPCRPRQLHFVRRKKRENPVAVQVCRVCGKHKYFEYAEVEGKFVVKEIPNPFLTGTP